MVITTPKNENWCALSVCALDSDLPHWGTWANLKLAPLLLVPSCVVNELLVVARGHTCVPTLHNNIRGMTQFDFTLELFSCKCPFMYVHLFWGYWLHESQKLLTSLSYCHWATLLVIMWANQVYDVQKLNKCTCCSNSTFFNFQNVSSLCFSFFVSWTGFTGFYIWKFENYVFQFYLLSNILWLYKHGVKDTSNYKTRFGGFSKGLCF